MIAPGYGLPRRDELRDQPFSFETAWIPGRRTGRTSMIRSRASLEPMQRRRCMKFRDLSVPLFALLAMGALTG